MIVLAIDPGTIRSAWLVHNGATNGIRSGAISPNEWLLAQLRALSPDVDAIVIEQVASYGMAVGVEVFETVHWAGRFAEAAWPVPIYRLTRKAVVLNLCGSARAKDANVRRALLDRYGGDAAVGRKAAPGPLYGIHADLWAALGVAVTWADMTSDERDKARLP